MHPVNKLLLFASLLRTTGAEDTDDLFRYVIAFNPLELDLFDPIDLGFGEDVDLPFLDNIPSLPNGESETIFDQIIEFIAEQLGLTEEPLFNMRIGDIFEISVREMPESLARAVSNLPFVTSVEEDQRVAYELPTSQTFSGLSGETLTYGIQMVGALDVSDASVANRKVCIIDSGYDPSHPDLPSAGVEGDKTSETLGPWNEDGDGHGKCDLLSC